MTDSRPRKTSGSPQDCGISNESIGIGVISRTVCVHTVCIIFPHNILHCLGSCVAASISPLSKITGYSILLMGKITKNNNVCSTDAVAGSNLDERCDKMTNKISPV